MQKKLMDNFASNTSKNQNSNSFDEETFKRILEEENKKRDEEAERNKREEMENNPFANLFSPGKGTNKFANALR